MQIKMVLYKRIIFFFFITLLSSNSFAQTISVNPNFSNTTITNPKFSGYLNFQQQNKALKIQPKYIEKEKKYAVSDWVLLDIISADHKPRELFITIENTAMDSISFFNVVDDSLTLIGKSGDWVPAKDWIYKNNKATLKFNIQSSKKLVVNVFKKTNATGKYDMTLRSTDNFTSNNTIHLFTLGLYFGLLVFCVAFGIACFLWLKERIYLTYVVMSLVIYSYAFMTQGYAYQFIYGNYPHINDYLRVITICIHATLFLSFSLQYFENYKQRFFEATYIKFVIRLTILLLCIAAIKIDLLYNSFKFWYVPLMVIFIVAHALLYYLSYNYYKVNKFKSISFAAGLIISMSGNLLLALKEIHVVKGSAYIVLNGYWIGNLIEMILFAFVFAYRIKDLFNQKIILNEAIIIEQQNNISQFYKGIEQEKERVAQELHDNIATSLVTAKMLLENSIENKNNETVKFGLEILNQTSTQTRDLAHNIMPKDFNNIGFEMEIQKLIKRLQAAFPKIKFIYEYNAIISLENFVAINIYRAIQEILNNAVKHSDCKTIRININDESNKTTITIIDDGKGFNTKKKSEGIGFKNIRSRMNIFKNINYTVHSSENGTEFIIRINKTKA